ncbi:MAG: MarR family winged helix-turn-helix transcriptional regulator [Qingshengfaniella sp.]
MLKNWSRAFRQGNAVYQLNILGNAAIASIERRFIASVGFDIRTIRVLRLVGDNPGITFADITVMTALERSLTSRLIQALVREGHIERRNDPTDARRFGLYITPSGQTVRRKADLISDRALKLIFQHLSPAEIAAFIGTMETLADWIDTDDCRQQIDRMFDDLDTTADDTPPPG